MNTKLLRQRILDLAIRGKLVPQDPNDEPASILLERIRAQKEQLVADGKIKKTKHTDTSDKPHYQNTPFDIPNSWQWVRLGEVVNVMNGKNQKAVVDENGQYPIYGSGGIIGYANEYLCKEHSTIIGRKGTIDNPILVETKFWNVDTAFGMEPNKNINYLFFYYFCKGYNFKELDKSTTLPSLTKVSIGRILFPLPPLAEQKRIVAEIERWFALIEELEANKQDLQTAVKRTKAKVLDLAIHGKLVPQDPTDEPAIDLLHRINPHFTPSDTSHYQKPPFDIPNSWQWVRLTDVAISELGKTLDTNKNTGIYYDYLCALNVKWFSFDFTTVKQIKLEEHEKERYLVKRGDLLICEGGDVGRSAIWESETPIYYQNALHRVRFHCGINPYFFLFSLYCYKHKGIIDDVSGGVTIKHFTQNAMQKIVFPLPPLAEQKRIVAKIESIFAQLDNIAENIQ